MKESLKLRGEDAAVAFIERVGMVVVDRHSSCEAGEIDLVALDGQQLVLVNVKTVRGHQGGEQAVSAAVACLIRKIASAYVEASGLGDIGWRYDQITLLVIAEDRALLRHHRALASGE